LSGVWLPSADLEPDVPPLQEWAAKVAKEHASRPGDDPRAQCLPTGVVRTNALDLAKFVHTPNLLLIVLEGSVPGMRQVFLDGRRHPADPNPTWLGDSIGTWDHDTLVVDTIGFNDKGWLDNAGHPNTARLRVTERFRRKDFGHMDIQITIDDPKAYTRPWDVTLPLTFQADDELIEYICNENNKYFGLDLK